RRTARRRARPRARPERDDRRRARDGDPGGRGLAIPPGRRTGGGVTPGRARALIVSDSGALAARIEAALPAPGAPDVVAGPPGAIARLVEEHDPLLVVLATSAPRAAAALDAFAGG